MRLTKKSLGKLVPGVGVILGFGFNFDTVSRMIDTAEMAYRRRFLLDKYPWLADEEPPLDPREAGRSNDEEEETISIVDLFDAAENDFGDLTY